ncbi:MAG: hypothetical protein IT323_10655 [Anaerolineae bacterium]|nr:hypothetical protein [Anaerolineae bacterium]
MIRRCRILLIVAFVCGALGALVPPPHAAQAQSDLPPLPDEALLSDPAWARPGFAPLAAPFLTRTRYLLALDVDPYQGMIRGQARILFVNNTGADLDRIVLRLYPNHPNHGARQMTLDTLALDGAPAEHTFSDAEGSVAQVRLPASLAPGGTATLDAAYTIRVGLSGSFYIAEPFPMVAVFDEYGWREDVVTSGLDYAHTESALMAVNLRAPAAVGTWFTGAMKSAQDDDAGRTTYTVVTGPMRNFVVIQAQGWGTLDAPGGPVPVRVLYNGSEDNARLIGTIAKDNLAWFDANLGYYPYAEFDVVAMSFPSGGEEYPSLVFVNNDPSRGPVYWRWITAHEVAHQWFYGIAGNDTIRRAWLDESLVQVAGWLFYLDTYYGSPNAPDEYWSHVLTWYNRIQGPPKVLDTPPEGYADFADFMSTIYGGGAVYMRQLAEQIGPDAFANGLKSYVAAVSFGIGAPRQFFDAMQAQTTQDLRPFFCERVGIMC